MGYGQVLHLDGCLFDQIHHIVGRHALHGVLDTLIKGRLSPLATLTKILFMKGNRQQYVLQEHLQVGQHSLLLCINRNQINQFLPINNREKTYIQRISQITVVFLLLCQVLVLRSYRLDRVRHRPQSRVVFENPVLQLTDFFAYLRMILTNNPYFLHSLDKATDLFALVYFHLQQVLENHILLLLHVILLLPSPTIKIKFKFK